MTKKQDPSKSEGETLATIASSTEVQRRGILESGVFQEWGVSAIYMIGDFFMRVAVLLVTFQISLHNYGSNSGYVGIVIFFQTTYVVLIAGVVGLAFAAFVDSKIGVFVAGIISCVFVIVTAFFGILSGVTGFYKKAVYIFRIMEFINYSTALFEPARMVLVLFHSMERTNKFKKTICITVTWLRELAIVVAFTILQCAKNSSGFHSISNLIAIICVLIYAVIISIVQRVSTPKTGTIMALKIVKCYATYLPNVNNVKAKFFEPDPKFTLKEKYCTVQLLRIYRALSAFIIFYFTQQLLYVVWDFQSKLVSLGGYHLLQSIHLKLAFLNLINLPLIFGVLFPFLAKTKKPIFTNNLKLLSIGYLALLVSLLITMLAQFLSSYFTIETENSPGAEESMIRIFNMIPEQITINSSWTGSQILPPFSQYVSEKFEARGIVSSQLIINGPGPLNQFSKSIFTKELESATFVIVSSKMRRVQGYDDVHEGVLDRRGPMAIISTFSTLLQDFNLKIMNLESRKKVSLEFPTDIHMKKTQVFHPGNYKLLHSPHQEISLKLGTVYTVMMFANGSKTFPTDYHYLLQKQSELPTLPTWSFIAVYFLSVACMVEVVLITIFIVSETPHGVRVLMFAFYFFNKLIGSDCLYLLAYILNFNNLTMTLFVTFWIYIANACFYWAVMIKFKSLRYTPDD